jgi:epoxyqueuosine reductase
LSCRGSRVQIPSPAPFSFYITSLIINVITSRLVKHDVCDLRDIIGSVLSRNGVSIWGVADLSCLPEEWRPEFRRAVVFALPLDPRVVSSIRDGPTGEYCDQYILLNAKLTAIGEVVERSIRDAGHEAVNVGASTGDFDRETLSADFPHKLAATRAGLGWIGKCDLLVTRRFGSAIRFNTVLTDAPIEPDTPIDRSYCGDCLECKAACPVSAPTGKLWSPGDAREAIYDVRACYLQCSEYGERLGFGHPICGRCIPACPFTRKYLDRHH